MPKQCKKGFTMIEVLSVFIVLAVILLIAVPLVSNYITSSEKKYYDSTLELVKTAGREYYSDKYDLRPKEIGDLGNVDIDTLVNQKYIQQPKSSSGSDDCKGKFVIKKKASGDYEYFLCMTCGNYSVEEDVNFCSQDAQISNFTIVPPLNYQITQNSLFVPKPASVYNNGELIIDDLMPTPMEIDTYKLGSNELVYTYKGISVSTFVVVVDKQKPVAPSLSLRTINDNNQESVYQVGDYTNKTIRIYPVSSDGSGSGISHYLFSNSVNGPWKTAMTFFEVPANSSGDITYYVKAVDNQGNESEITSVVLSFDITAPTAPTVTGMSSSCVYKNNYQITLSSIDNHSGVSFYQIDTNGDKVADSNVANPFIPANGFSNCNVSFRAVDKVGNYGSWSSTGHIHQDTEKPVITGLSLTKSDGSSYTSGSNAYVPVTITPSATDNMGILKYIYSTDGGTTWTDMSTSLTISKDTNATYLVKVVDLAGNISDNYKEAKIIVFEKITKYRTQGQVTKYKESCSTSWTVCGNASRSCSQWSRTVDGFPESNPVNGWICDLPGTVWPDDVKDYKHCCSYGSYYCPCCTGAASSNCQPQSNGTCAGDFTSCSTTSYQDWSGEWSKWTTTKCTASSTLKCESKSCLASSAEGNCDT